MGAKISSNKWVTLEQAKGIAGEKFDQAAFDSLQQDNQGRVLKTDLQALANKMNIDFPVKQASGCPAVRLALRGNTHIVSEGTIQLLKDVGGPEAIIKATDKFYELAFQDKVLDTFILSHADPHGERLGLWIVEKMGGHGNIWTNNRPPDSRQRSHFQAWNSKKRPSHKIGLHFKLDDCRIWMRLHFLAARETGLLDNKQFYDWYIQFIGHFVAVYERRATAYAKESAEWSANPENIQKYIDDGRVMMDVIGQL